MDVLRGAKKGQAAVCRVCAEGEKLCHTVSLNIKPSKLQGLAQSEEVSKRDGEQVRGVCRGDVRKKE